MLHQPDKDGRIPLRFAEYDALRNIIAAYNAVQNSHGDLQERLKTVSKDCWRSIRIALSAIDKAMAIVLASVPKKKLEQIRAELAHTRAVLQYDPYNIKGLPDGYIPVKREDLWEITKIAMEYRCTGCSTCYKKAKRDCTVYTTIQAAYPYQFDDVDPKEVCPCSDLSDFNVEGD